MAIYRKVDTRIWGDAKFRDLSDDSKFVFLFLLTHPNLTSVGAMRCSIPALAAELNWTTERLSEGLREPFRKGMLEFDSRSCFIAFPNFQRYNKPENPNVVRGWRSAFDMLPECQSKDKLLQRLKEFTEGLGKGFAKAFTESFAKGLAKSMPNQEQEQEQEQDSSPLVELRGVQGGNGAKAKPTPKPGERNWPEPKGWRDTCTAAEFEEFARNRLAWCRSVGTVPARFMGNVPQSQSEPSSNAG